MMHLDDELLDRYVDGALTTEERAVAEAHLLACGRCRRELAALRDLFATFAAVPTAPLPLDLAPRVLRRIAPEAQRRRRWLIAGFLAAQAALTLLLAFWLVPPHVAADLPAWLGLAPPPGAIRQWLGPNIEPLAFLAPLQWLGVVAGMAVIWLVGNRLILARRAARVG